MSVHRNHNLLKFDFSGFCLAVVVAAAAVDVAVIFVVYLVCDFRHTDFMCIYINDERSFSSFHRFGLFIYVFASFYSWVNI